MHVFDWSAILSLTLLSHAGHRLITLTGFQSAHHGAVRAQVPSFVDPTCRLRRSSEIFRPYNAALFHRCRSRPGTSTDVLPGRWRPDLPLVPNGRRSQSGRGPYISRKGLELWEGF